MKNKIAKLCALFIIFAVGFSSLNGIAIAANSSVIPTGDAPDGLTNPAIALDGVEITSPSGGATVGGIVPVTISWSTTPDKPVVSLYCTYRYVLGSYIYVYPIGYSLVSGDSGTYTFNWDTSNVPNGIPVSITVTTHYAGSDTITLTAVNNPYPVINIISPTNGEIISKETSILPVTVEYHNIEPNYHGIRWISLVTSGGHVQGLHPPGHPTSGTYTWHLDITTYPLGEHWIHAYCEDTSGKGTYTTIKVIIVKDKTTIISEYFPEDMYSCPDYSRLKDGDIDGDGRNDWFYESIKTDDDGNIVELWGIDPTSINSDEYFAIIFNKQYLIGKCPFSGGENIGDITYLSDSDGSGKPDRILKVMWSSTDKGGDDIGTPIWPSFTSVEGQDKIVFEFYVVSNELRVTHYDEDGNKIKTRTAPPAESGASWIYDGELVVDLQYDEEMFAGPEESVEAYIVIKPETLNLASKGVFTVFITLKEPYNISEININTVLCAGAPALSGSVADDGKYVAKFDREDIKGVFPGLEIELTLTGELLDGTRFEGSDTIRVIGK